MTHILFDAKSFFSLHLQKVHEKRKAMVANRLVITNVSESALENWRQASEPVVQMYKKFPNMKVCRDIKFNFCMIMFLFFFLFETSAVANHFPMSFLFSLCTGLRAISCTFCRYFDFFKYVVNIRIQVTHCFLGLYHFLHRQQHLSSYVPLGIGSLAICQAGWILALDSFPTGYKWNFIGLAGLLMSAYNTKHNNHTVKEKLFLLINSTLMKVSLKIEEQKWINTSSLDFY